MARRRAEPVGTYQDKTVIRARVTRSAGLEADACQIEMTSRAFGGLEFERRTPYYRQVGGQSAVQSLISLSDRHAPLEGSIQISGDLILDDGERGVAFADMYVRDDGIEVLRDVDDEAGDNIVRLELVPITYFWARRGEIFGGFNLTTYDGFFDAGSGNDGVPWTLLEIVRKLLDALPGRPPIRAFPDAVRGITPMRLDWRRGASPKDELDQLLKKYSITPTLTPTNEIILTDESEDRGESFAVDEEHETGGARLPPGAWRRRGRAAFLHRPEAVRVVGAPAVREVTINDMEPVGFALDAAAGAADRRRYVSAAEAGRSYLLEPSALALYALLPQADQVAYMTRVMGAEVAARRAVTEINEWAFRMFRIPAKGFGLLPILPERAEALERQAARRGGAPADDEDEVARRTPPLVEAEIFVETAEPSAEDEEAAVDSVTIGLNFARIQAIAKRRKKTRFVNLGIQPIANGVQIDSKHGVVKFDRPVGHLVDDEVPAQAFATIRHEALRVRITFAYEDSVRAREALEKLGKIGGNQSLPGPSRGAGEVQHVYGYLAGRNSEGAVSHLNPDLRDSPSAAQLFPQVVRDETLRLFVRADGTSNKGELDRRARAIAERILLGPEQVRGEDGEAMGFHEIMPSSVVSTVSWTLEPGVAKTEWSIRDAGVARRKAAGRAIAAAIAGDVDRVFEDRTFGVPP